MRSWCQELKSLLQACESGERKESRAVWSCQRYFEDEKSWELFGARSYKHMPAALEQ